MEYKKKFWVYIFPEDADDAFWKSNQPRKKNKAIKKDIYFLVSLILEWPQWFLSDHWGHSKMSENTIFTPNSL